MVATKTAIRADANEIRGALECLLEPNQVHEIRVLNVDNRDGNTSSGYYEDLDALAAVAARYSNTRGAGGVYFTLNPVLPSLLARSNNRVTDWTKTATGDSEIVHRRWLPIDLDPVRPSGISATDQEHQAAIALGLRIREDLREAGWPDPVRIDSGNGAYLLYRVDLDNSPASATLLQSVLAVLAETYDNAAVKVDRKMYNAARIIRIPYTVNRKGDDTADRPHRAAQILEAPEDVEAVDVALLEAVAEFADQAQPGATTSQGAADDVDLDTFLERHQDDLQPMAQKSWNGGRVYRIQCPYDPAHGHDARIGERADGVIFAHCKHNSCTWTKKDLLQRLDPTPALVFDHLPVVKVQTNGNGYTNGAASSTGTAKPKPDATGKAPKLSMQLLGLALPECTLFTDKVGIAYAQTTVNGARQTWRIESAQFGRLLTMLCAAKLHTLPGSDALTEVRRALSWHAMQSQRDVFMRVGGNDERIYLDLGRDDWAAVEIDADGWRIVSEAPVAFRRSENMKPLPIPVQSDGFGRLRRYVNITEEDWPLVAAWTVNALRPTGPYPILAFISSAGSAKSTATRVLKTLIDPAGAPLRPQPKDLRDLMIAANHSWVLGFDNVSHYPQDVSDALCRLATGGGYTTRSLYTDDGEYVIEAQRPIIFNGISEVVQAADLMDRCIIVMPPTIDDKDRMEESQFWRNFNEDHPILLGQFLNAVSGALRALPDTRLDRLPRMADFAKFATAAENAMGMETGTVYTLYTASRENAMESLYEASPLAHTILELVQKDPFHDGAERLLFELNQLVTEETRSDKGWPKNARSLSTALNRLAPVLKSQGVTFERGKNGSRFIHIQRF